MSFDWLKPKLCCVCGVENHASWADVQACLKKLRENDGGPEGAMVPSGPQESARVGDDSEQAAA